MLHHFERMTCKGFTEELNLNLLLKKQTDPAGINEMKT